MIGVSSLHHIRPFAPQPQPPPSLFPRHPLLSSHNSHIVLPHGAFSYTRTRHDLSHHARAPSLSYTTHALSLSLDNETCPLRVGVYIAPHNCSSSLRATHAPSKRTPYDDYATLMALSLLVMLLSTVLMPYRSAYSVVRCARSIASVARASLLSLPENVREVARNLTWRRPQVRDLFERVFSATSAQARAHRCSDGRRSSWKKNGNKYASKLRHPDIYSCVRKGQPVSGERSIRALRQRFSTPGVQQYEHLPGMKRKSRAYDCHACENASPREHVMAGIVVWRSCLRNRWRRMLLVLLGVAVVLTAFTILLCGGHTNVGRVMPGGGGSHDIDTTMSPVSTIRSRGIGIIAAASTATTTTATVTATIKQTDTRRQATYDHGIAKVPEVADYMKGGETNAALPETADFVVALSVYVIATVSGVIRGLIQNPRGGIRRDEGRRSTFSRGLSIAATSIVMFACLGAQPYGCSATMLADTQSLAEQTVPISFHQNAVNVLHVS